MSLAGLVEAMVGMLPNETRSFVLPLPETWGPLAEGETQAKIVVTLAELLEYLELPEVSQAPVSRCRIAAGKPNKLALPRKLLYCAEPFGPLMTRT